MLGTASLADIDINSVRGTTRDISLADSTQRGRNLHLPRRVDNAAALPTTQRNPTPSLTTSATAPGSRSQPAAMKPLSGAIHSPYPSAVCRTPPYLISLDAGCSPTSRLISG
ncbi:MAG: hypothetical protein MJ014_07770 [Methanocorpusculum sp.]|nr:hypothetical protein [Methanocorpusculum sp.]